MSTVVPDSLKYLSSSLTSLSLSDCLLQGNFPINIFHLPNLQMIRLSQNPSLAGKFLANNWTSPIEYLDVSETSFSELPDSIGNLKLLGRLMLGYSQFVGLVPASLGNLTQLTLLHLMHNNFSGHIPSSLSNLVQLTCLDLSSNSFVGEIPDIVNLTQVSFFDLSNNQLAGPIPSHGSRLQNLVLIRLNNNSLSGTKLSWLLSLLLLEYVRLSDNQLSGHIDEFPSKSLQNICLSNNRLQGSIPSSIFELVNLTDLQLDSNNFSGIAEPYMFAKLIKLKYLYLSHNSLSLGTTFKIDIPFPKFSYLSLSACNIRTQHKLFYLDLSESKIDGQIPSWISEIGKDSLSYLNLSHNFITKIKQISWKNIGYLDLRSNLLQGPLLVPPSSLRVILISNNQFTGEIIHSICDIIALDVLDLSNNRLSGTIPECIGNFSPWLSVMDLRNNRLNGSIPGTFAESNWLRSLNLNNNELGEGIPQSLVNCTKLEVLDIGNNKINDAFPYWLGNLPEQQVLVLRSNKFHGSVREFEPKESFPKLRILDLSINNFSGYLPERFLENLNAMRNVGADEGKLRYLGEEYYQDSVVVTLKGTEIELQKILTVFTTIDFSSNGFDGEISQVIGKLHSLRLLNLSHNHFTGQIPSSLGNLAKLESLDLSSNNPAGKIPKPLTSLTSLSVLNLSHNQLDGLIPHGPQFNTFQEDSYIGNLGLCGFPLTKKCSNDEAPTTFHEEDEEAESSSSWFDWKFAKIGYGSGLVIGMSIGYMVFSSGEPLWFMKMVVTWQSKKLRSLEILRIINLCKQPSVASLEVL
ncbi:hypothetical protein WN943_011991 [Citrus x changshan-huyou]